MALSPPDFALKRLEPEHDPRPPFECGDKDLDEFFHIDSIEGSRQLLSVTYAFMHQGNVIAFFSVSNDAIKKELVPRSGLKRLLSSIPTPKRYRSMPAAKIGRLGVAQDMQARGVGTMVLDYLKASFTQGNKTGCRFLLVDAYNNPDTIRFYQKNGFAFLTGNDESDKTRIMYFDLMTFRS